MKIILYKPLITKHDKELYFLRLEMQTLLSQLLKQSRIDWH